MIENVYERAREVGDEETPAFLIPARGPVDLQLALFSPLAMAVVCEDCATQGSNTRATRDLHT